MRAIIHPSRISGTVRAPQSKSIAIRLLLSSLLGRVKLEDLELSEDVNAAIRTLEKLGVRRDENEWAAGKFPVDIGKLDAGGSGTVLRMIIPILACLGISAEIDGDETLRKRPLKMLRNWLISNGVEVSDDHLPIRIKGRINTAEIRISGAESSQYISGFIFGLLLTGGGRISLIPPVRSQSYIWMTCDILNSIGCRIEFADDTITVHKLEKPLSYEGKVGGDFLLSSFYALAAVLTGGEVSIENMAAREWSSEDYRITSIIAATGQRSSVSNSTWKVASAGVISSFSENVVDSPDMAVSLAALAAGSTGISTISGIELLSIKESDRVSSISETLTSFGCDVETNDGLKIRGPIRLQHGETSAWNDHRITMLGTVLSLVSGGTIEGVEAINKSNPRFFEDLIELGGDIALE